MYFVHVNYVVRFIYVFPFKNLMNFGVVWKMSHTDKTPSFVIVCHWNRFCPDILPVTFYGSLLGYLRHMSHYPCCSHIGSLIITSVRWYLFQANFTNSFFWGLYSKSWKSQNFSLADPGRRKRRAPPRSNFFHFHAVFGKNSGVGALSVWEFLDLPLPNVNLTRFFLPRRWHCK